MFFPSLRPDLKKKIFQSFPSDGARFWKKRQEAQPRTHKQKKQRKCQRFGRTRIGNTLNKVKGVLTSAEKEEFYITVGIYKAKYLKYKIYMTIIYYIIIYYFILT